MDGFIGRDRELAALGRYFARVGMGDRPGRAILMRGRRRVGKTRLAEEFIRRSNVPSLFFTAAHEPLTDQLEHFIADAMASDLPDASLFEDTDPTSWNSALQLLALAVPQDSPSIVVLDELPLMIAQDPHLEGRLQRLFDREFSRRPMLLILIGSDLSVMEAINQYDRPFYMRASEMVVHPLTPADVQSRLQLPPADAFDAYLVTGGFPMILDEWPDGATVWDFLNAALSDPTSALMVSGERAMAAEFPPEAHPRTLLKAIGNGQRTFSSVSRASGGMPATSIKRAMQILMDKRMITSDVPLSTHPSKERRYHVADTHLRFWLSFLENGMPQIERGRGDLVLQQIRRSWTAWRGAAIEPLIRESLRRLDALPEGTAAIGGFWTRTNDPEIHLVGADREPIAKQITMLGSVKWLENRPFDRHDLNELTVHRSKMPGANDSTPLYAVSRSGCDVEGVRHLTPEELLAAWQ
ncbi:ATP-binding protein [Nonomuraea turkmeniaca]|uniref:ATP-binding protein n=1 Tax=Nonomuraea turkmeniaca TaxID=103838 RepID=A0A5S4EZA5_9ACTN|nr:ATP-binding protein [Nonomuraea turkmeniaca]TMR09099.1 ATP-binding protein [Nonomuraea turkmeniaca]